MTLPQALAYAEGETPYLSNVSNVDLADMYRVMSVLAHEIRSQSTIVNKQQD